MAVLQNISLSITGQSIENNTSTVRILWQSSQTGSSGSSESCSGRCYISVNHGPEQEYAVTCALLPKSTVTVLDTRVTVSHDLTGSCLVTARIQLDTPEGQINQAKGITLPTLPTASIVTATSGNIGQSILLVISRRSDLFTHTLQYEFGDAHGWIGTGGQVSAEPVYHTGPSVAFTLPESFYNEIPNHTSGAGLVICSTYLHDTLIGSSVAKFTAYAESSLCQPDLTGTVEDCNPDTLALTGDKNILVRHMSTARCTVNATAKKGAAIATKQVGATLIAGDSVDLQRIARGNFTFSATDSRGYKGEFRLEKTVIPYIRLTSNPSVRRKHPTNGTAELTLQGNYYSGTFGAKDNTLTVSYKVGDGDSQSVTLTPGDGSYEASVTLSGLDYRERHAVTVTVSDALETVVKTLYVDKGLPVFDWGENDFAFHVPVVTDSSLSGAFITAVRAWKRTFFRLKTKFSAFDGTEERQSIFLFGGVLGRQVLGVICVDGAGNSTWSGTEGITLTAEEGGVLKVALGATAYDHFLVISPEPISTIT